MHHMQTQSPTTLYQTLLSLTSALMMLPSIPSHSLTAVHTIKAIPSFALPLITPHIFQLHTQIHIHHSLSNEFHSILTHQTFAPQTFFQSPPCDLQLYYIHTFRDPIFRVHGDITLPSLAVPCLFEGEYTNEVVMRWCFPDPSLCPIYHLLQAAGTTLPLPQGYYLSLIIIIVIMIIMMRIVIIIVMIIIMIMIVIMKTIMIMVLIMITIITNKPLPQLSSNPTTHRSHQNKCIAGSVML